MVSKKLENVLYSQFETLSDEEKEFSILIQNEEIKENVEIQKQCRNRILNKDFNSLSDDEITFLFELVITEVTKRLKEEKEFTSSMDLAERQDKYKALLDPYSLELIRNIKGNDVSKSYTWLRDQEDQLTSLKETECQEEKEEIFNYGRLQIDSYSSQMKDFTTQLERQLEEKVSRIDFFELMSSVYDDIGIDETNFDQLLLHIDSLHQRLDVLESMKPNVDSNINRIYLSKKYLDNAIQNINNNLKLNEHVPSQTYTQFIADHKVFDVLIY